jgi:hypothetical protein
MLSKGKRTDNKNSKAESLNMHRVRAGLMMHGKTLKSFARDHQVSRTLLVQIIKGERPARSGKSAALRRKLEEVAA